MRRHHFDTTPEYWGKLLNNAKSKMPDPYLALEFEEFLKTTLPTALSTGEFWWKDLARFYFIYSQQLKGEMISKYAYFKKETLDDMIKFGGLTVNTKDRGGNTFIHYLLAQGFRSDPDYNLLKDDIPQLIDYLDNPLELNNQQHTFFWYLNNILYARLEPEKTLGPLVKKYNLDVLAKDTHGIDLFEQSVSDNLEDNIAFYLKRGAKVEKRKGFLGCFVLHFFINQSLKKELFDKALTLYDPFDNYTHKKTQYPSESIMENWVSFLQGQSHHHQYFVNFLYVLKKIQEQKVALHPKNEKKIRKIFKNFKEKVNEFGLQTRQKNASQVLEYVDSTQIVIDKYFLDKKLKKSTPSTQTPLKARKIDKI